MSTFYTKDKLEFLTVAVETCKFLEHAGELEKSDFVSKMTKLLPLLYLKTSMVQVSEDVSDDEPERFVSEVEYAQLRAQLAGIMVYISLDELLPTAERYGKHHYAIMGVVAGMIFMALSLVLLK